MTRFLASALLLPLALGTLSTGATALLVTPSFTHYAAPSSLPGADRAAGPTLGFGPGSGEVLYQAGEETYRIGLDHAASPPTATWTTRTPTFAAPLAETVLHTDPVTGRTWRASVVGACTTHASTDDGGMTWTVAGTACLGTHSPSLSTGPSAGVPTGSYPRALYSCAQASTVQCARSDDGGATFGPPGAVLCAPGSSGAGGVHAGVGGAVYVPFLSCGSVVGVAVSLDYGRTWNARPIPGATPPASGFAPDAATPSDGHLYVAHPTSGHGVGVARSTDHGLSWTGFGDVAAAAGVRSATFHQAVGGDAGRVAVAFLGSTTDGDPHASSFTGVWRLYASVTYDGGATWTTVQTAPNLIQRGWICADGTACASGRNLGESMDAGIDGQGRLHVALADGCRGSCETGTGASTSSWATLAVQTGGTGLRSAYD